MSFISKLLSGGSPQAPKPAPVAPRIGDAMMEATAREERMRLRRRKGLEDTILTGGGLGDMGTETAPAGTSRGAQLQRTSLLGGGAGASY